MINHGGFLATAGVLFDFAGDAILSKLPKYQQLKSKLAQGASMTATCGCVTGVITALFTVIALTALSPAAFVLGILSGFVAYNSFAIASNLTKIAQDPARYAVANGLNKESLKKYLSEGTWQCEWLISFGVDTLYDEGWKKLKDRLFAKLT